jgi:ABC-type Fe3+-siderophore transport system permease subunit
MIYKFDKDQLLWKKNWKGVKYLVLVVIILILISFISGRYLKLIIRDI